jgi:hypothetical protein
MVETYLSLMNIGRIDIANNFEQWSIGTTHASAGTNGPELVIVQQVSVVGHGVGILVSEFHGEFVIVGERRQMLIFVNEDGHPSRVIDSGRCQLLGASSLNEIVLLFFGRP